MSSIKQTAEYMHVKWGKLQRRYDEIRLEWNDIAWWNFNRDYWLPLVSEVEATQKQMHDLAQVIEKAKRELGNE